MSRATPVRRRMLAAVLPAVLALSASAVAPPAVAAVAADSTGSGPGAGTVTGRLEESVWRGALEAEGSSPPPWWAEAQARFPVGTDPADFDARIRFVQAAYAEKGRPRRAIRLFTETAEAARAAGATRSWLRACHEIAHLYGGALQDHARSLGWALRCARTPLTDPIEARQNRIAAELAAVRAVAGLGRREQAVDLYRLLARQLEDDPDPYGTLLLPQIFLGLGDLLLEAGSSDGGPAVEAAYRAAVAAADRLPPEVPSHYLAAGSAARAALRRLSARGLELARVPDGTYRGDAFGYNAPVAVRLTFRAGRCAELHVTDFNDKRPLDAYRVLPERILDSQSLEVDAVTGATVTSRAIVSAAVEAVFRAQRTEVARGGGGGGRGDD